MNSIKINLLLVLTFFSVLGFSQVTLNQYHIAVGNSSNQLSGSTAFQYDNGVLTMGSTLDNYLSFQNGSGTGYLQYDANGRFTWWTPGNGGVRKMALTTDGKLKIGDIVTTGTDAGANYKLQVWGDGYLWGKLNTFRDMGTTDIASAGYYTSSSNYYRLNGSISNSAYHTAQENHFTTQNGTITGYQSSAQNNTFYAYNQIYNDGGSGHIWSVQTNNFYPDGSSNISKFINTYIRTQLGSNNTIGTYYSLFLEAPYGAGNISGQIANYYGVYQESSTAKNFFGGKVGIGTTNVSDPNYKLFVDGGIRARKVRIDQTIWADYVFAPSYTLLPLKEVEEFIKQNKHLPEVPSASDVEKNGLDLADNQALLLKKIEELTLYIIEQDKKIEKLEKQNEELKDLKEKIELIKAKVSKQ